MDTLTAPTRDSAQRDPAATAYAEPQSKQELRFFAAFTGFAILLLASRVQILRIAHLGDHYPLLFYQDVLALAAVAWLFRAMFAACRGNRSRRIVEIAGWSLCILWALYTAIATIVFWYIRSPLTYRLIALSEGTRGVESVLAEDLSRAWTAIPADILIVVALAALLWRVTPRLLRKEHAAFYSIPATLGLIAYLIGAHLWVARNIRFTPAVENPEWAFASSLIGAPRPTVSSAIPPAYFADFHATRQPAPGARAPVYAALFGPRDPARPLNVVMVIMESVGAKNLHLTGASYPDSPALDQLAQHAIVFRNTYVAQPFSSAAMAALFASLYPDHDWMTIPRKSPAIRVPKLPALLEQHGYRTAFIHSGSIDYDGNLEFLENHGFQQVISRASDDIRPRDGELVPAALNWIKQGHGRPFFLAMWTRDTHNPYLSYSNRQYVRDYALNRYLNSVAWTDQMIGNLADALKRAGLAENTLLVISGDHGEAFQEHGQSVHNFSVYNEEVRIPLMFVNPRLIPHRIDVTALARQIDIAPSVLDLLNVDIPPSWQGTSLFAAARPRRAYLFSIAGDFRLGLAEDDFVYIRNYSRNRQELYNVADDLDEQNDLAGRTDYNPLMASARTRLEAWLSFQNNYLGTFDCRDCKVVRAAPEDFEALARPPYGK
jgi:arylsulfatase A-like enzyme